MKYLLKIVVAIGLLGGYAQADELSNSELKAELDALRSQMNQMMSSPYQQASYNLGASGNYNSCCEQSCDSCCQDSCCQNSCGGSVYGELQFLYLHTFATEEDYEGINADTGFRLITGVEGANGLGLRFRWFNFDGTESTGVDSAIGLDLEYFDLEVTKSFQLCDLHGVGSVGYRHASYNAYTNDPIFMSDEQLELNGLTFGLQVDQELTERLGLFAWVQQSLLYGDDNGRNDDDDTLMGWTEAQVGLQYSPNGSAFVRAGVEAQRHDGGFDSATQDTGLFGFFLGGGASF